MDAVGHFIFKTIPQCYSWVRCVYLFKDDALNDLCGKSHTFMEIEHELISTAILLPSADSRRVVVSCKRKYVHKVLVNCLVLNRNYKLQASVLILILLFRDVFIMYRLI